FLLRASLTLVWAIDASLAKAVVIGDIVVVPQPIRTDTCSHGYMEYRILVTNRSKTESHEVTLTLPKNKYELHEQGLRSITRTIKVEPTAAVRVSLYQPNLPLVGTDLGIAIDGKTQATAIDMHAGGRTFSRHEVIGGSLAVLVSPKASAKVEEAIKFKGLGVVIEKRGIEEDEDPDAPPPEGRVGKPPVVAGPGRVHPLNG